MGIPLFASFIRKTYPHTFEHTIDTTIDLLCLDYNAMIYPYIENLTCSKTIIERVLCETTKLILSLNPTHVYIAVDGVCPRAKMIQQRYRRYMSSTITKSWDTNAITPGTEFMKLLTSSLKKYSNSAPNIEVSSAEMEGEGEHKIIRYIANNNIKNKHIVVTGLDADLILLLMPASVNNKVTIYREENLYINVTKLRNTLNSQLGSDYLPDLLLIFSLLGNDFLPPIRSLNDGKLRCTYILNAYKSYINSGNSKLAQCVDNTYSINIQNFKIYISNLYDVEIKMYSNKNIVDHYNYYNILDIPSLVSDYYKGLSFVLNYYLDSRGCPSWTYYYPHRISPYIKNILNTDSLEHKYIWHIDKPYKPIEQLLFVLPPTSLHLIPNKTIVNVIKNVIGDQYPNKWEEDIYETDAPSWHKRPILPDLDTVYIQELLNLFS